MRFIFIAAMLMNALIFVPAAHATGLFKPGDGLLFQTSVWTKHYSPEPDHINTQRLINFEYYFAQTPKVIDSTLEKTLSWRDEIRWLAGIGTFKNSFGQQSTYVYGGGRYDYPLGDNIVAYAKLTAGLLHGYRGEFKDKIPFNDLGVAPIILPGLGVQYRRVNVELVPFAAAGVMLNVGFYLF